MPFTPAHVAAVLPLRRRGGLPFSALVVGSMIPDLPYYLPGHLVPTPATHSVPGIVTWDLLLGLAVWALWCVLRPRVYDVAPQLLRSRWRRPESGFTGWSRAPLAVIIGAATHVLWDEFTHAGRFGATYFAVLAHTYPSPLGPLEGYRYLQYASGVIGLLLLFWAWYRTPRVVPSDRIHPRLARIAPVIVIAGGAAATVCRFSVDGATDLRSVGFALLTAAIGGAMASIGALCVVHSALRPPPA